VRDSKELLEYLARFKKQAKEIVPLKEKELQYYHLFADFLQKYEETNKKKDQTREQSILLDPQGEGMRDRLGRIVR